MKTTCPRCQGAGVVPRTAEEDGTEADRDLHPFVAVFPKTCPRCGGNRKAELTAAELAEKSKDRSADPSAAKP